MTELKMRRLVAAGTAAAVILAVVLVAVLVSQLVVMAVKKAEIERLQTEIVRLQDEKARLEEGIDLWLQDWKIEERARQLGMVDG
ncbi:MAG: septum formation initiator family protein [Clostridia bacterium]|nr:septum formation initiator family protein [Clostridia bacterium]